MSSPVDDLIPDFILESQENLNCLDQDFIALEKAPADTERLASVFRTIHTIKGTCGYLNFAKLGALTHAGETLLGRLRDGSLHLDEKITTTLLEMVDAVRAMLISIEKFQNDGDDAYGALIEKLQRLESGRSEDKETPAAADGGEKISSDVVSHSALRVQVELLDRLMNLAGELVLARNHLLKRTTGEKGTPLAATLQQLNRVTTELHEAVMKTRMQRIGQLWQKLPRLVRDLSLVCGKKIRLQMSGEDTDLDKTLLEAIKDPLLHAIRNAVDHGIETPQERMACGKPAEGLIALRAFHEAGYVIIEMADDGAGLNLARIKQKGLDQGLITAEQGMRMKDQDIAHLIFAPGFSTADKVTDISGRGVGMDVVKTNIEKIGGTVNIHSLPGKGVTLKMRIPLTLAIIPALIVSSQSNQYAIPQVNLLELLQIKDKEIEDVCGALVYRLHGRFLPLVYLDRILNQSGNAIRQDQDQNHFSTIVVLKTDDRPFGLVVETVHDTEEIVVKPLGRLLKDIACYAGATIMGDGKVALILDVMGLAQEAHVVHEEREQLRIAHDEKMMIPSEDRQTILLFQTSSSDRIGVPLNLVERLEEISTGTVERSNQHHVVQYRGQIMPLFHLSQILGRVMEEKKDFWRVVVVSREGRFVGLVVDKILDIVTDTSPVKREHGRSGFVGSAVIQGKVTDLLDIAGILQALELEKPMQRLSEAA